ncbi:MAG TPA: hypothetical protein VE736_02115 [Gaiellaceae bacterium]|jgi:hypothetical protein|nr:hypothetical protein [Gaiellaceae bacterium]
MTVALLIAAVLAVVCAIAVALPFLREPAARDDRLQAPDDLEQRRLAIAEERDRALAALKELEFDHRTGKISDDDYRAQVGPLRRRAAKALRALEVRTEAAAPRVRSHD